MHWNIGVSRQRCNTYAFNPLTRPTKTMKDTIPPWCLWPLSCVYRPTCASHIWGSWESGGCEFWFSRSWRRLEHCFPQQASGATSAQELHCEGQDGHTLEGPLRASFSVLFKLGSWGKFWMMCIWGGWFERPEGKQRTLAPQGQSEWLLLCYRKWNSSQDFMW